jgi:uncharacterized SAM-binding protein YcdF (DUF218 family)
VLFLWPPRHVPQHADAIVVLAGARAPRLARGLALVRRGVAPMLLVSDGWGLAWVEANRLCAGRRAPVPVLCFRPDPYSTRGEARTFARIAVSRGWQSVVVVTSRYHVERAGILFNRCFGGTVYTDGAEQSFADRLIAAPLETIKLANAFVRERC